MSDERKDRLDSEETQAPVMQLLKAKPHLGELNLKSERRIDMEIYMIPLPLLLSRVMIV